MPVASSRIAALAGLAISLLLAPSAGAEVAATLDDATQVLVPLHPRAAAAREMTYGGTPIDVTTFHYDRMRTGWNAAETDLGAAAVASPRFGRLAALPVDGLVLAQPLLVSSLPMPDGRTHQVLVVATGHDSVYAFDARSYALLWQRSLGVPQSARDVGCPDVQGEYGISSTPVIVRAPDGGATLYVAAAVEPAPGRFETDLHAIDLATGVDRVPPVAVDAEARLDDGSVLRYDPRSQWNRAGLAFANGALYVGIGSHCDTNRESVSGWLLRYGPALTPEAMFHTIEAAGARSRLAGIWMSGFAPAVDDEGNVFVVTGNGSFQPIAGHHAWGQSVLRIDPRLEDVIGSFTPVEHAALTDNDLDFGSGGVMLLPPTGPQPATRMAVAMGKDAVLYLLDQHHLGGPAEPHAGALQATRIGESGAGLWGGPAFYAGPAGPTVFVQITADVLRAYLVASGEVPSMREVARGTSEAGYGGSMPVVSSNGAAAGSGVVWVVRRDHVLTLEAYDAVRLGPPLYTAVAGVWPGPVTNAFISPLVANGRVYVASYRSVSVFGLTPP